MEYKWIIGSGNDENAVITLDNGKKMIYCEVITHSLSGLNDKTGDFTEEKGRKEYRPVMISDF